MTHILLYFEIYSLLGWIAECFYTRYDELRWVNRGFLHGPFCPIYGMGAVACLIFLAPMQSRLYVFIPITMFIATAMEYLISWFFENTFHVRLWTYSHKPFNLHGRICLEFTLLWGFVGLVFVKIVHPQVMQFVENFTPRLVNAVTICIGMFMIFDLMISAAQAAVSTERLEHLERIDARLQRNSEQLQMASGESLTGLQARISDLKEIRDSLLDTLTSKSQRFFDAFPHLESPRYPHALLYIQEKIKKKREEQEEEEEK